MTKKDYIDVADGIIRIINNGYVKKKDITRTITAMCYEIGSENCNFNEEVFVNYIRKNLL